MVLDCIQPSYPLYPNEFLIRVYDFSEEDLAKLIEKLIAFTESSGTFQWFFEPNDVEVEQVHEFLVSVNGQW